MKTDKPFDCIAYKRGIQEKHATENRDLSPEEKIRRRTEWLEKSSNPAARLWRRLRARKESAVKP